MCRISPVGDDWIVKGFHIHVHGIEIAMRPDHVGGIVFRKVFRSTKHDDATSAIKVASGLLHDIRWRARFRVVLGRAIEYMNEVQGDLRSLSLGRAAEFRFLAVALDRMDRQEAIT